MLLSGWSSLPAAELTGRVVGVTDDDTITVLDADKVQHKIRHEGIDAPESKQAFGTKAKQALSDRVFGKDVRVEWKERDRYKRIPGHVYAGEDHVNLSMVRDGFAWHFKRYNKDQKLADAEVEAREAGRGLWADKEPVPPWEFRKQAREKAAVAR
ncbi:MAG: thermonuclease family protein [Planctomycetaceae bacterium]|nr:thermonuclease family protein [Planctomycetaceae bacterium]